MKLVISCGRCGMRTECEVLSCSCAAYIAVCDYCRDQTQGLALKWAKDSHRARVTHPEIHLFPGEAAQR